VIHINIEVTLQQMLLAREERVWRQQQLLDTYKVPLICFTMNIPGPVKLSPLIRRSFRWGLRRLEGRLTGIVHREVREEVTGCEAFFAVAGDAPALKKLCTEIEDETPLGRLFDMDVLGLDGNKLDRSLVKGKSRDCIVCGAPGRGCASRRLHSLEDLTASARTIMEEHFLKIDGDRFASMAVESLLEEVHTTPKPGLVDQRNSGSHRDMDIALFTASAETLRPYFRECFLLGQATADRAEQETFDLLRQAGLWAEKEMYRTTGGVNTHKGAIFTLGILCGSLGKLWNAAEPLPELPRLLDRCGKIAECALKADFCQLSAPATAGERLYVNHGITGIRGEAAAGLPSVWNVGLPAFREALNRGLSRNDAGAVALLHLIAYVEDTNLHHRGGASGAAWAKAEAKKLLPHPTMAQIEELDDALIARNLSPGGCADLLAVTLFLDKLERGEYHGKMRDFLRSGV